MTTSRSTVLAIGAHHDDIELGCGGTLASMARAGHDVHVFIATRSSYSDPTGKLVRGESDALAEAQRASAILGVTLHCGEFDTFALQFGDQLNTVVRGMIERIKPDTVFTHSRVDVHSDHWALCNATLHATRHVPRVAMYRSNWYQGAEPFRPTLYFDISDTLELKIEAIRAYQSEWGRAGTSWAEYFTNQARNDGLALGVKYAEGFQPTKWLLR